MPALIDFREPFREEGYWWLPQTPNKQVAGTLAFDQEGGVSLSLAGLLAGFGGITRNAPTTIHGITKKGQPVTLLKCWRRRSQINMPGISHEEYFGHWVLLGCHIAGEEDAAFGSCDFTFDAAAQWLEHKALRRLASDETGQAFKVERLPAQALLEGENLKIWSEVSVSIDRSRPERLVADAESLIRIEAAEPQTVEWHFNVATKLQSLACVCAGQNLPLSAVRVRLAPERVANGAPSRSGVDVLVQMVGGAARQQRPQDEVMLSAPALLAASREAVTCWLAAYEQIDAALNLFFGVTGPSWMYSNVRFVLAVQALEAYHRSTSPAGLIPDDLYAEVVGALRAAIPPATPSEMREKLVSIFEYSNEPSLAQRLRAVLEPLRAAFGPKPVGISPKYIRRIVRTRNQNTHYSGDGKSAVLNGAELHWATRRLATLLTILFLRHIGVPDEAVSQALEKHREFSLLLASEGVPPL